MGCARGRRSTAARDSPARAAERRSSPGPRATARGWRTGARAARQERSRLGRRQAHEEGVGEHLARCVTPGRVALAVRAPHLQNSLRCFCLGAFRALLVELDQGADLPFAFEEHASRGRPALYEYRPLVRTFLESRAWMLAEREDARLAVEDLRREPAARIFSRAHAGARAGEDDALFRTVVMPLLIGVAETCGGF